MRVEMHAIYFPETLSMHAACMRGSEGKSGKFSPARPKERPCKHSTLAAAAVGSHQWQLRKERKFKDR